MHSGTKQRRVNKSKLGQVFWRKGVLNIILKKGDMPAEGRYEENDMPTCHVDCQQAGLPERELGSEGRRERGN